MKLKEVKRVLLKITVFALSSPVIIFLTVWYSFSSKKKKKIINNLMDHILLSARDFSRSEREKRKS
jgi:hypothetical protein